jgi:2-keto-3-deoxy-L-rhamnonate aldolase RhmA
MTITVANPDVAAHAANLGFDFLWIEMEHSPITLETARNMILATRGLKAMPFTRVPVNELWMAKRVLDAGSIGVVFPFTSTPELARQAVAACKYPPVGLRGAGPGLASFRWQGPENYSDFADRNAMVIIIIEQKRAVDQIEEIAAVPGIDVLFIGTNDLSFSYGKRGRQDPEVQEAIRKVVAAAKKNNVPVGRPASSPEQIQQFIKDGFTFFQASSELGFMATGSRPLLQSLGKSGIDPKQQPLY